MSIKSIYMSPPGMKGKIPSASALRALAIAAAMLVCTAAGINTQSTQVGGQEKKIALIGTWTKRGLTYRFDADSTLTIMKPGGGPSRYLRTSYRWFSMGTHNCIMFRRDPTDSLSTEVLLVGAVTDTSAVLALGTPFVRSGEGRGLPGSWKHMDPFTRIEWVFSPETVSYRKSKIAIDTGLESTIEEYSGTWERADAKREPGTFAISFGGGSRTFVLPVVHRNIMYLFDVGPGKSVFTRPRVVAIPDTLSTTVSMMVNPDNK